uniref:Phosphatidylinositol n-acetylglucosaminyltransferase subunit p n=1 Tax=Solanum tuberosum TaxID=4113 RepID=M0ZN33_SOLTU
MLEDKGWEDPRSVNSPRRILSFSKNRKATVFFPDPDDRDSGFGVSGDQGPKTFEVYGFVGSITTVVATVELLLGLPGNACAQASPVSGYRAEYAN